MGSNSILFRMPAGIPGDVTRDGATIEPNILGADASFGAPLEMSGGKVVPFAGGTLYGFLVRPYPTQGGPTGLTDEAKLPAGSTCDVLRRGYISATLASGTAAKAGTAYLRIAAATGKVVGDIEAALVADETKAIVATFMGPADADGNVELAYNI